MRPIAALAAAALILAFPLAISADPPTVQPPHIAVAVRRVVGNVPPWEVSRGDVPRAYCLVAYEVTTHFPRSVWLDMTAIGIAESAGEATDIGDRDTPYPSVGLFQIRLVHRAMLVRLTGSTDSAVWVRWLEVPGNNAQAAAVIWRYGGMKEWGAWTDGRWRLFISVSKRALEEVQ